MCRPWFAMPPSSRIPIHARGAGTGLAGESLGPGLMLDFSRSMRRIVGINGDTVTVQPGVVLGQLNRYLAGFGRQFGPDPATGGVTTMGSVLALDNSGSNWLRHGSARKHVVSMQMVLADGEVLEVGRHPVTDDPHRDPNPRRRDLVRRLAELIDREQALIKERQPKAWVNRCGYHLYDVLHDMDTWRAGSGPPARRQRRHAGPDHAGDAAHRARFPSIAAWPCSFFDRLESAATAAIEAQSLGLAACDLIDRRILSLARDIDDRYARAIPRDAEAMLMIEQQAEDEREVIDGLQQAVIRWQRRQRLAFGFHMALAPEEFDAFRRLARRVSPTLYRVQGAERPTPFVEDIAVPPEALPDFLVRLQNVLKAHDVTASFFAHAGHGQLHVRPFLNLADPDDVRKMQALADELYEEVFKVGGTISGEHGSGLSRTWFLRKQFGPLYDVFREVKRIFDPQNLLNPGKVIADVPQPITKNLRTVSAERACWPSRRPCGLARPTASGSRYAATSSRCELHLVVGRQARRHGQRLQRLRPLPHAVARRPHVPDLSPRAVGRSLAAGQGQSDAGRHRRPARSRHRWPRTSSRKSPICASIATVPPRMPGQRRYSQADDRGQGPVRRQQRPRHGRLAADAPRLARPLVVAACPAVELAAAHPQDPLAAGKNRRHRPRPQAAARRLVAAFCAARNGAA